MLLLYDAKLTLLVLFAVLAYGLVRLAMYPALRARTDESLQAAAQEEGHFIESIRAVRTLKAFGQERARHGQWLNRQHQLLDRNTAVGGLGVGYGAAQALLAGAENVAVIYFGAQAVLAQSMTIGMLYAFIAYRSQFNERMTALIDRLFELRMLGVHLDRLADIVARARSSCVMSSTASRRSKPRSSPACSLRCLRGRPSPSWGHRAAASRRCSR
jgi:ATP-binding cassette subfamily B protein RaxB